MNGFPVGRLFGVEIRLQLGWILVLALIGYIAVTELEIIRPGLDERVGWVLGGVVALGFLVSSVAHDLAHAVIGKRSGMPVTAVIVTFFGGSTPLEPPAASARDDLAVAAAGPIASIAIGAVLGLAAVGLATLHGPVVETAAATLGVLTVLNLILGFVNLLPAYPLDGGRIIRAIGWLRGGSIAAGWGATARTGRFTGLTGVGIGLVVMFAGAFTNGAMIALSGWFLVLSARSIAERLRVDSMIGGLFVEDAMEPEPVSVGPSLTVDTFANQLLDAESEMTAVPVVSESEIVGVLGVREVRRLQPSRWPATRVEEVMTKPPRLVLLSARDTLTSAVERLQRAGVDGLPVVDGGALVGMLTRRSVGQLLHERGILSREGRTVA
jgi:Zn-dependent protease/CBS domain-containing protein